MSEVQAVEIPFKKGDIIKYNATGHVANVMNVINTPGRQAIIVDNDDKVLPFGTWKSKVQRPSSSVVRSGIE